MPRAAGRFAAALGTTAFSVLSLGSRSAHKLANHMMSARHSLDGWWEFQPAEEGGAAPAAPPRAGYADTPIRVPGYWNTFPPAIGGDWGAYDHYGYPADWQGAAAAWYRLRFRAPAVGAGRKRLVFDAVAGHAAVWLNGRRLGDNTDSFLPFAFDVSGVLQPGEDNELAVHVGPPPTKGGLWLQPPGSWVGWHMRGIWQPVYLETTPALAVRDIFAQPSVRQDKLTIDVAVECATPAEGAELHVTVLDGASVVLDLGRKRLGDAPEQVVRFEAERPPLAHWSPESPRLYFVRARIARSGQIAHEQQVRFGFREFWLEGTGLRLNGRPLRLFGDSWHYMGPAQQNPAYARTWFEFAKAAGVNAIRTHAMPYPPCYFDVADEMGMLLIDESAVYGSAGTLAYDEPAFWDNCRAHLRRLVLRDRNHPSIIAWSACNETVWKGGEKIFPHLLSLGEAARGVDPTRVVTYDENDSDLGGGAPTHGGHYGTPAHWDRSWSRAKPLMVHEFSSLYHGGPESVSHLGDEAVYADYFARLRAAGEEAADMFLRLRSLGAASITPWNLNWYCLEPLPAEAVEEVPAALTAGGAPLRRIGARALTLNYGYLPGAPPWRPNPAHAPLAECYRRRRFFLRSRPRQGYAEAVVRLTAEVWNDESELAELELHVLIRCGDDEARATTNVPRLAACAACEVPLALALPPVMEPTCATVAVSLRESATGAELHSERWELHVHPTALPAADSPRTPWLVGTGEYPADTLSRFGVRFADEDWPARVAGDPRASVVLSGPAGGRTFRAWFARPEVEQWVRAGGRLIVLPDAATLDDPSALAPLQRTCDRAYPRDVAGGVCRALTPAHFRDWGPAGTIATLVYPRPATGPALAPLDVGDAAEGLSCTPLVLVPHGAGCVVLCGMPLLERAADTPAAALLLHRLLHDDLAERVGATAATLYTPPGPVHELASEVGVVPEEHSAVLLVDGGDTDVARDPRLSADQIDALLAGGGTLLLCGLTPATADAWSRRLGVRLHLQADERFNVARAAAHPLLAGLNNFDLCWVNRDDKQPIVRWTLDLDDAFDVLVHTVATRWEGYQTAAEQHKVALMYRRIEAFAGPRAAVVALRRGPGRVIISQLLLPEARDLFRPRARRILSRWLDVCGVARADAASPLAAHAPRATDARGYITQWLVCGPFQGAPGHPLDHAFVDEARLDLKARDQGWRAVSAAGPQLDLGRVLSAAGTGDRVAYAAVGVYSPQDRAVLLDAPDMVALLAGADGGLKVLLNGEELGRFDFVRELVADSDRVDGLPLKNGWNTLVLKLHNRGGPWRFVARLVTAAGTPARDLQFSTTPP